jgi:four helix bundle protein
LEKVTYLGLFNYDITKEFPDDEKSGLIGDMKRAINSIIHNISEGSEDMNRGIKRDSIKYQGEAVMNL